LMHPQAPWWIQMWVQRWRHQKEKELGAFTSLQHFKVEGRAGALGWGLGRLTSKSITHINLHKPNNKLVSAQLEHLWCMDEPRANTNSQDSPRPRVGGSHHLPPYSILYDWPQGQHPNVILSQHSDSRHFGGP
jgi:hypothetical protein